MKISELIQNEIEDTPSRGYESEYETGKDFAFQIAIDIAQAHEAEYGWQPIATAPKDKDQLPVRDEDKHMALVAWSKFSECWVDSETRWTLLKDPTEWYKFPESEGV